MMDLHVRNFAQNVEFNTFIGGIAKTGGTGVNSIIDTPAKLALKLGIHAGRVKKFKIVGDDVSCSISNSYTLKVNAFGSVDSGSNANIKSFNDIGGKVSALDSFCFYGTSIEDVVVNAATSCGSRVFDNCSFLKTASLNSVTVINGQRLFSNCIRANSISLPNLTTINGDRNFQNVGTNASSTFSVLDIRKCKVINYVSGGSTASNFFNIKIGITIKVHIDLFTASGGLPHPDLVDAKNNRSCIIEFYDNAGNYVSTL